MAIALSSLPACSGTINQTPPAMATMKIGIVKKASVKDPVACCSATVANGHSTNPTKKPINQTTPLATPRMRVGKTSAVSVVLGPQKPRNPKLQARPKIQSQRLLAAYTQRVIKTAPQMSSATNAIRRPILSASQPAVQSPKKPTRPQNT